MIFSSYEISYENVLKISRFLFFCWCGSEKILQKNAPFPATFPCRKENETLLRRVLRRFWGGFGEGFSEGFLEGGLKWVLQKKKKGSEKGFSEGVLRRRLPEGA